MDNNLTITKSEIKTPESLTRVRMDKDIPHYGKMPENVRKMAISAMIAKLYLIRHQIPQVNGMSAGQVADMDATMLDEMIMEDSTMSDFTMQEIEEAFRDGIFGKYGEFYGINATTLYGFLRAYMRTPKKRRSVELEYQERKRIEREEAGRRSMEEYERRQKQLARMEEWGAEIKTVTEADFMRMAKDMFNK